MLTCFEDRTADAVWRRVSCALQGRNRFAQASRAGKTYEILHATMTIADPRQRWVFGRAPILSLPFAIAEIVWIVMGRNDSAFLNYFNADLPKFAGEGATYHGAYGFRLRKHAGIDQLERAYSALKGKPLSRQIVLQIWDAKHDFPHLDGTEVSKDVPCNVCSSLKVRDGKLHWLQFMRSNDIYRGMPYNFVQFTALQEILAGWLNVEVGQYTHVVDSLHVYQRDAKWLAHKGLRSAVNSDSIGLPKKRSDQVFAALSEIGDAIISPNTPVGTLPRLPERKGFPEAYKNFARVLCAEGARRRGGLEVAGAIMERCSNPAYRHLFGEWLKRWHAISHRDITEEV